MTERRLYRLNLKKLDERAHQLGVSAVDLLGLAPRHRNGLIKNSLGDLIALSELSVLQAIDLLDSARGVGRASLKEAIQRRCFKRKTDERAFGKVKRLSSTKTT